MFRLISPAILNDNSFEYWIRALPAVEQLSSTPVTLDLSTTEALDTYALLGILLVGIYLKRNGIAASLILPKNHDPLLCMAQAHFTAHIRSGFDSHSGEDIVTEPDQPASFLLPITPISQSLDIHDVVMKIRQGLKQNNLDADHELWNNYMVIISELCQNIPEHSKDTGFTAIALSEDHYHQKLIHIVIMDSGIGIKNSLSQKFFSVFREKWSDHLALHKTLYEGVSRHDDPGRGNGIVLTFPPKTVPLANRVIK